MAAELKDGELPAIDPDPSQGKFCIKCRFFEGYRSTWVLEDDHGACGFRQLRGLRLMNKCAKTIKSRWLHPVTGQVMNVYSHITAANCRRDKNACGPEGKWYEEYTERKYVPLVKSSDGIGGQAATEIVFDDATIEANRKAAEERLRKLKEKRAGGLANIKATEL